MGFFIFLSIIKYSNTSEREFAAFFICYKIRITFSSIDYVNDDDLTYGLDSKLIRKL